MKKTVYMCLILVVATALVLGGCAQKAKAPPVSELRPATITYGAMLPGSATYIWVNAMANVISKYSDLKFTVEPYADNTLAMRLFKSERVHMVTGPIYETWSAARGLKGFEKQPINHAAAGLALKYGLVTTDPTVKSVPDMKGKRVMAQQPPNTGTTLLTSFTEILKAYGMDIKDVNLLDTPAAAFPEVIRMAIEGKVDIIWTGVAPWMDEVRVRKPLYAIPLDEAKVKSIAQKLPGYLPGQWEGEYGISKSDFLLKDTFGLFVHRDLAEDIVYTVLKTMYAHEDELKAVHPGFLKEWILQFALRDFATPMHPGAIKYYKEKGLWTADLEAKNKRMLDEVK